ncbi:hypothetical protein ACW9YV_27890 (plasmid) [Paraburkholderia strydomiana]
MKTKATPILTPDEAQAIIDIPKATIRPMEWIPKRSPSNPQWMEFVSVCRIENEIREDLFFRTQFRAAKTQVIGDSTIRYEAVYNAAITAGGERIFAVDADDTQHTNKVGVGRPLYKSALRGRYHMHTWSAEGYGYAEPIDIELNDIELLVDFFLLRANLTLISGFIHPLRGSQIELEI